MRGWKRRGEVEDEEVEASGDALGRAEEEGWVRGRDVNECVCVFERESVCLCKQSRGWWRSLAHASFHLPMLLLTCPSLF